MAHRPPIHAQGGLAAKPGLAPRWLLGGRGPRHAKPGLVRRLGGLALVGLALTTAGCDSGATGIEACRSIETARCQAVVGCPGSPVTTDDDISNCELFYRDHCLHGMADGLDPDQGTVDACVTAINMARACQDAGQTLGACNAAALDGGTAGPTLAAGASAETTGCQAVQTPEVLQACNFLAVTPTAPGSGGSAGTGGAGVGGAGGGG